MGEWTVMPKSPEDEDVAVLAERILNSPTTQRALRKAWAYSMETGVMPDDQIVWSWLTETEINPEESTDD